MWGQKRRTIIEWLKGAGRRHMQDKTVNLRCCEKKAIPSRSEASIAARIEEGGTSMVESLPHKTSENRPQLTTDIVETLPQQPFCVMIVDTLKLPFTLPRKTWKSYNWWNRHQSLSLCKTFSQSYTSTPRQFSMESKMRTLNLLSNSIRWVMKKIDKRATGVPKLTSSRSMRNANCNLRTCCKRPRKFRIDTLAAYPWKSTALKFWIIPPQYIPIRTLSVTVTKRRRWRDGREQCIRAIYNWIGVAYCFRTEKGRQSAVFRCMSNPNAITTRDSYLVSRIDEYMDSRSSAELLSTLDVNSRN